MGDRLVEVGVVGRVHGLRGGLVLRPFTPGSDLFLGLRQLFLQKEGRRQAFNVLSAQEHSGGVLVLLEGLGDRTAAEGWTKASVWADEATFPEAEEGEYWARDLVGLAVVSPEGEALGEVIDLESSPVQDWLVVRRGETDHLVPLRAPLARVEMESRRIVVDAPEGLFEVF